MKDETTTETRDEELGAALRALDVPDHRPGFELELRRRLREERRAPARRIGRGVGGAAVVVAAAAAIAFVFIGLPRAEVATAAQIKAQVRDALTELHNLRGTLVSDGPQRGDERRWRFVVTAEGDVRLSGPTPGEEIAYDVSAGVVRSAQRSASLGGGPLFYAERTGVAPGRPDLGPPTWLLPEDFGAYVRALLAAEDPRVREVTYDGRRAWRLDVDAVPNAILPEFSGNTFEVTVDRGTGIPVRVVERKSGAFVRELRIENLAVNVELAPDAFELAFPAGAEVMRSDDGFRRVELADVAAAVGYQPLLPAWVPGGYELAEVAVAREAAPTGTEAGNPPSRMIVSLSYRRGLDQFLVTTRLAAPGEVWDDPLATAEGFVDDAEPLRVGRGVLAGEDAELVLMPRGIPHVWAVADDLVVTVGGDLSRDELVRVTESLRRS